MHVRNLFTVMAFLVSGAVSLPTPIPNGDLTAAAAGNHITRDSTADLTYNGAGAGPPRMRRAIAQPMRLVNSKREISVPTDHDALAGTKREESITADKSYEGAQWNGGGATKGEEAITADKSYEG